MVLLLRFLPYGLVLAAIIGGWWWVDDMRQDLEAAQARASILEEGKHRAETAAQALTAQLRAVEEANAQRDRDYRSIAAALRAGQDARRAARAADPVLGNWAATPHPPSVADGLREAGDHPADGVSDRPAAGGTAVAD
jgi:hypothetical protein